MKKIYIINSDYEECRYNKPKTDLIMPHTAFHYIIDGYGYFNGVKLGPGDFFCAVENQKVCYYPDEKEPWKYYYFDVRGTDIDEIIEKFSLIKENAFGKFNFFDEIIMLNSLFKTHYLKNAENVSFFQALAFTLLSLHNDTQINRENLSLTAFRVKKIKDYIDRNFNKKITLEDISKKFFLSRAYIRNIFFDVEGIAPKKYLQNLRMEKAAELLKNTEYKVSEISASVGYEDQLTFSKAFKNHFGSSPINYRIKNFK